MKIVTDTVEDFIDNLKDLQHPHESLFRNVVYVHIAKSPAPGQPQDENCLKFSVIFTASAVITKDSDKSYFLECILQAGIDYADGGGEESGTANAKRFQQQIKDWADAHQCRVLKGFYDG